MNNEIIEKINQSLNPNITDIENDKPYFSDKRYKAHKIEKTNFHEIKETETNKKIAFIDGGNAEILKTANFSLQLVRVYATIYQNNKRIDSKREEFFVLTSTITENQKIKYKTTIFNNDLINDQLTFDLYDKTLQEGGHKVNISKIGEVARRFAELKLIEKLTDQLNNAIIVRDGSLQSSVTHESKYFESLYKKALEKNTIIAGLCKTTTLITEKGNSLTYTLTKLAPVGTWYYHPVVDIEHPDHQAELFFTKLHKNSNHTFRFEFYKRQKPEINELLSLLARNSKDPIFFGYPYGLIEADRFARITNNEKEYWKTIIASKLKFNTKESHEILDSIS
jgi:hypothetical protein